LALGALYPARVRAAIWISGRDGLVTEAERRARREQDGAHIRLLERSGLASFVEAWEALPLFASQRALPEVVQKHQRLERSGHTAAGLAHSLRVTGLAEMPHYGSALGALDAPVTLLVGAADVAFCQHAAAVVGNLRNGSVTALAGAGHNLLLERPDAVASAIERGLQA
jgi:2-succinyl-6-hydroxy-2,4-cyclohexadiene-1-carboxylate synthase